MINPNDANLIPIFERIREEVARKKQKGKAFVIGINGIDGSGKTKFAASLEAFLQNKGHTTQLISLDDFHNPKAVRYAGKDQADNYYNKSFNISLVVEKLLVPLRRKSAFATRLTLLDWRTDRYNTEREYSFNQNTIVIFEGVFLFRKELSPYIDYKVFLEIPLEESKRRATIRDPAADVRKYDIKYLPAQSKYLAEYPPTETADMVIDNTDWEHPVIKYMRKG